MAEKTPPDVSKHTILGKIRNSYDYFLINLLAGSADIIAEETAIKFKHGVYPHLEELLKKGYLLNREDEKLLFINSYCDVTEQKEKNTLFVHFIPHLRDLFPEQTQPSADGKTGDTRMTKTMVQSFFSYLDSAYKQRKKTIILSGGESLLPGNDNKNILPGIFQMAGSRHIPLRLMTNGYFLHSYIPFVQDKNIEEIHSYLDFSQTPFNKTAAARVKSGYFQQCAAGVTASLENDIKTHITILIRQEEIEHLYLLAAFAGEAGWTRDPLFSAEVISRENNLLCSSMRQLFPYPLDVAEELYNQIMTYPEILELCRPPLSITYSLLELTHLPHPVYKACPGGTSELVCTPDGKVYPCLKACNIPDECLGTFYPEITVNKKTAASWEERDITTIKECTGCRYQLGCGGGCTFNAKRRSGKYNAPDCIPVRQFMEVGLSLYFDKKMISRIM